MTNKLHAAVESTFALLLARLVTPTLLAALLAISAWYASRIEKHFEELVQLRIDMNGAQIRVSEIERRLNSPRSPISYTSSIFGVGR